jgi:rubrerythrin
MESQLQPPDPYDLNYCIECGEPMELENITWVCPNCDHTEDLEPDN